MSELAAGQTAIPLPSAEINLGGTSTTEKLFLSSTASGGVAAGQPLACRIPGTNTLKNRPFRFRVVGRVTGGGTTNFTVAVYLGNSATVSSNVKIATSSTNAVNSMSSQFMLVGELVWDSTSTKISGWFQGNVNATIVALASLSTAPTSQTAVDLSLEPLLTTASATAGVLTVTGTFSSGFAGNVAILDTFEIVPL